jgi:phosphatidylglycerol---prolipoprotein diacylglyceryl transferase
MFPILYQNHDLILFSYPLLMGIGWGVAYQIFFSLIELPRIKAQILFWGIFIFAWIGAKLFFILTSGESAYLLSASFWTGGGFVFYGGLLSGCLFISLFKLTHPFLSLTNLWPILPALTIGHGIGRIGCFLAGCCFGKPTDFFWGVFMHNHHRHPTQIIEASVLLSMGVFLLKSKLPKTFLLTIYLVSYGVVRLILEALRGDTVRGLWGGLTPSQVISILLVSLGLGLYLKIRFRPKA